MLNIFKKDIFCCGLNYFVFCLNAFNVFSFVYHSLQNCNPLPSKIKPQTGLENFQLETR